MVADNKDHKNVRVAAGRMVVETESYAIEYSMVHKSYDLLTVELISEANIYEPQLIGLQRLTIQID